MSYRVGEAANPKPDDPTFAELEDAETEAKLQSGKDSRGLVPVAIWNRFGEIEVLYYIGIEFKPV